MILRSTDRVPAGEAFARRVGAALGLTQGMNRLVIADVDRGLVRRWVDEGPGRAPGYSLVAIDGPYPDDLVEQIVDLHAVMNTAPREDLDQEDEIPTVEQAREMEKPSTSRCSSSAGTSPRATTRRDSSWAGRRSAGSRTRPKPSGNGGPACAPSTVGMRSASG